MYCFILKIITYIHYILQHDETKNNLLIFRQGVSVFYEIGCWYDALPQTVHGEFYGIWCWYDIRPKESMVKSLHCSLSI